MTENTNTPNEEKPQKVGQALNTGWRKYYFPVVVAITAAVIGFLVLAYMSSQRFTRIEGFGSPTDVAISADGTIYISDVGESTVDGDGVIYRIQDGEPVVFASGLNDPAGVVLFNDDLVVADQDRIWRIDSNGQPTVWIEADAFEETPTGLEDIVLGFENSLFVMDRDLEVVFHIKPDELDQVGDDGEPILIESFVDSSNVFLDIPGDILYDLDAESLWVGNFVAASMVEFNIRRTVVSSNTNLSAITGLAQNTNGIIYIADATAGKISTLTPAGKEDSLVQGLEGPTGMVFDAANNQLIVIEIGANRVTIINL